MRLSKSDREPDLVLRLLVLDLLLDIMPHLSAIQIDCMASAVTDLLSQQCAIKQSTTVLDAIYRRCLLLATTHFPRLAPAAQTGLLCQALASPSPAVVTYALSTILLLSTFFVVLVGMYLSV